MSAHWCFLSEERRIKKLSKEEERKQGVARVKKQRVRDLPVGICSPQGRWRFHSGYCFPCMQWGVIASSHLAAQRIP